MGYERRVKKKTRKRKALNRSNAMRKERQTDRQTFRQTGKEIKILSHKYALKATACKSLPLGDNIIITNPYMNALPLI